MAALAPAERRWPLAPFDDERSRKEIFSRDGSIAANAVAWDQLPRRQPKTRFQKKKRSNRSNRVFGSFPSMKGAPNKTPRPAKGTENDAACLSQPTRSRAATLQKEEGEAAAATTRTIASGRANAALEEVAAMKRAAWLALLLLSACSTSGSVFQVPRTDCEALRDHFVEVSLTTAAGVNPPSERVTAELDKHRHNLKATYGDDWIRRCQLERDPDWVRCSLQAHDKQALAACHSDRS